VKNGQIQGFVNMGVAGRLFSGLLLLIVAFPARLVKTGADSRPKQAAKPLPAATVCSVPEEIKKLADLKAQVLLTEDEFHAKEARLVAPL